MPRFGKDYKMYRRILPSLELDITDVLENGKLQWIDTQCYMGGHYILQILNNLGVSMKYCKYR